MKRIISTLLISSALAGCAMTRGFYVGMVGGPQAVDEMIHDEYSPNLLKSILKVSTHQALLISTAYVLWPLTASWAGVSGIYGAYEFHKHYDKK